MTDEVGHPSWYSMAVTIGASLVSAVLAIAVSLAANEQGQRRERAARAQAIALIEQQRKENDEKWCVVFTVMTASTKDAPPPTTKAAKDFRAAIADLKEFVCK